MNKYMIDTSVFNHLVKRDVDIKSLIHGEFYFTYLQLDELNRTPDLELKNRLLTFFKVLNPKEVPLETFVIGIAKLNSAKLGDGKLQNKILQSMNKTKKHRNNQIDALIAETAFVNKMTLITDDNNLYVACLKNNIKAIKLSDAIINEYNINAIK